MGTTPRHPEGEAITVAPWRADPWEEAEDAARALAVALKSAGLTLPSLGVDQWPVVTGRPLVELGRARPDVVRELAALVVTGRKGREAEPPPPGPGDPAVAPADSADATAGATIHGPLLLDPDDLVTVTEDGEAPGPGPRPGSHGGNSGCEDADR
ncbi:hypothetical protein [Streptomyces zingiberis]|uniref:hypothetical protein n=1 Tax=Streptomyces zingiberis TaxID=2053010 RepID=UPI0019D20288|nr:hypothetical protein [Streptomyces zingiberis]